MTVHEENLVIGTTTLRRFIFAPDPGRPVRAAAIHYHGQGDHAARYDETLENFTRHGVACVATDLPGHGRSEGRCGVVPGFDFIDRITRHATIRCRSLCPHGPLGLLGHSAGGLIGLRELLRHPGVYAFAWISSPLVRPEANRHPLLLLGLPLLARLFPHATVGTGVTPERCRHSDSPPSGREPARGRETCHGHRRVGIAWGLELIRTAAALRRDIVTAPPELPILITQGTADRICPVAHLRALLDQTRFPRLRYREFPEALHEVFTDECKAGVFHEIDRWLEEILPASAPESPPGARSLPD